LRDWQIVATATIIQIIPYEKTITVELETWQQLTSIKVALNIESLDAVIKELLKKWKQ